MSKPNDGGRAFPRPMVVSEKSDGTTYTDYGEWGMSLRQYYAGLALPAVIAYITAEDVLKNPDSYRRNAAISAIAFADALIAELEKETT